MFHRIDYGVVTHAVVNQQAVKSDLESSVSLNDFSFANVFDAASGMYNGKTLAVGSQGVATNNFGDQTLITVEKQYTHYKVLNNFGVPGELLVYTFFPKSTGETAPFNLWKDARADYQHISIGANAPNDPYTMFERPTEFYAFNKVFKSHIKKVKMQPGGRYEFTRHGPATTYDPTSLGMATMPVGLNTPGKNSWVMFAFCPDISVQPSQAGPLHLGSAPGDIVKRNLVIERNYHCCIRRPEDATANTNKQVKAFVNFLPAMLTPAAPVVISRPAAALNVTS